MKNRNHAKLPNRPGIALRGIWYLLLFLAVVSLSLFFASKLLFGAALGMLLFAVLDLWAAKKEAQKFSGIQVESSKDSFILTLKKRTAFREDFSKRNCFYRCHPKSSDRRRALRKPFPDRWKAGRAFPRRFLR